MKLNISDSFNKELAADPKLENTRRQVSGAMFSFVLPFVPSDPKLVHTSLEVAELLGLSKEDIESEEFLSVFSGKKVLENTNSYAMCYAGHQFGNWAGQLGDGRAINLFEVLNKNKRWAVQLKGAGPTPYSRSADGLAVLRSSIREHLCSEAMFHLGVPTTRSLSLALSGDQVLRDVMYNGNAAYEQGAIVCRVAPSFIRFGNFEIFAAKGDVKNLKMLADYTIKYFYPEINSEENKYVNFFQVVADKTLEMIIHWKRVGFVHGVMNTDNMSILGITIDYGPYGWLENYDPNWTPNTTDRENRRYRFGNQGQIALWNLLQLANALFQLVEDAKPLEDILHNFKEQYELKYTEMMLQKIGIYSVSDENKALVSELKVALESRETDMTIFFRNLSNVTSQNTTNEAISIISDAFYSLEKNYELLDNWFVKYIKMITEENNPLRKQNMDAFNPKYVLRNYMATIAIDAAEAGDYTVINELYTLLQNPYSEQKQSEKWFSKRPDWAKNKVGSSMLSCSS